MKHPHSIPGWMLLLAWAGGCGSTSSALPDGGLPPLVVESVEPATVLPGTWVRVSGTGFLDPAEGDLVVILERGDDRFLLAPRWHDRTWIDFQIDPGLFAALGGPGSFEGTLQVEAGYAGGSSQTSGLPVHWVLERELTPRLDSLSCAGGATYLGSDTRAEGFGFLLEGEGVTELRLSGSFTPASGPQRTWDARAVIAPASRTLLAGNLPAEALGIMPGRFQGEVVPVNLHDGGPERVGQGLSDVVIDLAPTAVNRIDPQAASRGQWIEIKGRGFVAGEATTLVRIEGSFTHPDGKVEDLTGDNALVLVPQVLAGDTMRYVLRPVPDGHGGLEGLGAQAGVLRGTVTPVVYFGSDVQQGIPLQGELVFRVLPQKQVVYIKYLPGFTDALRAFGLRNVEGRIRARILEVVERDYQGINVEFVIERPSDFVDYGVIEVGGRDPNGMGLLGLDNTMGKDTGNLYLDDVVGGVNAETRESGHFAFGGVFVASYLGFSPKDDNPLPIASPLFDQVFESFMPDRGGRAVEAGEYPGGERAGAIQTAFTALGNMIGNTVSHEIGHTLGLADGPETMFHNLVPADDQIMDGGIQRDFEERAELNGRGPARWTDKNREYLLRILPE